MTAAMLARLAFAIVAAVSGGIWLIRALSLPASASHGSETAAPAGARPAGAVALRTAVLAWCALWALIWLGIALARLRYPFELEWNGGAMRDHCERVLAGRSLYVAPGADWFPYEYPPLYFWVSALVMRLLNDGSFTPMRLVSVLSTLGCGAVLIAWVRHTTPGPAGKIWGLIASGIFLATYRFTGAWYDIERLDMLFLFLSLLGGFWLSRADLSAEPGTGNTPRPVPGSGEGGAAYTGVRSKSAGLGGRFSLGWVALSAVAFWLAFLTKQQAVLFVSGAVAALAWRRQWAKACLFGAFSAALCLGSVVLLNRATAGWFGYYCFHVPLANGIRLNLAAQFVLADLPLYAPLIATILILAIRGRGAPGEDRTANHQQSKSAMAWCAMGVLGSLLSRAHWGGDQNVLMAGFAGLVLMGCILAARSQDRSPGIAAPLYALALLQMVTLAYRPDAQIPAPAQRAAGERYAAEVRKLEREGEVLCLDHGGVTTPRHFQLMALMDVIGSEKRLPPQLVEALRSRRYSAIVTDARPEPGGALDELTHDYEPTTCLHIGASWIATGFPTPAAGRQVWILRPKMRRSSP